jgi:hypothetical protein
VALALANLVKRDFLTWKMLADHKDGLDAASSAIGILVVTAGAVLSYFRFFHGRTFSTRAELDLVVKVYALPNGRLLHTISLSLKNVGGSAIWNPQPLISILLSDADGSRDAGTIDRWFDPLQTDDGTLRVSVIDTGETGRFPTKMTFDATVWTVTYMASITCDSGDVWKHVHIVCNAPSGTDKE